MLQVVCWVNPEDYWVVDSLMEKKIPIQHYGYRFEVVGGSEGSGSGDKISLTVIELRNANMAIGLYLPEKFAENREFKLRFISHENPTRELPLECGVTDEIKRVSFDGNEIEQLEYIGFSLERFYGDKSATFYLYDLKGISR
jgi:hypothetical protein